MASIYPHGKGWRAQVHVNGRRSSKTLATESLARAWADREEGRVSGMPALRAALSDHRIASVLPRKFREAIDRANYSPNEIIECSFPVLHGTGIYFLIREGEVSYVGQTTDLLARLARHKRNGKVFDAFSFIPCSADHLVDLEKTYITLLFPEENSRIY